MKKAGPAITSKKKYLISCGRLKIKH